MAHLCQLVLLPAVISIACNPAGNQADDGQLLTINSTELFVKRIGSGEPVVVVHGGPVLEHGYLLPSLEPLTNHYELIFYDQRLSGRSAGVVDSASVRLATFVDDLEALRQELSLQRIHLVAHSWGGLLAMNYAIRFGQHLRSLTLLSPISPSATQWREEEAAVSLLITDDDRREMQAIRETDAFRRMEPVAVAGMLRASFRVQFHDRGKASHLEFYVPADYGDRSRQFGLMMVDLMSFDLTEDLAGVTVPTLILFGDAEPGATMTGATLDSTLPNSQLVIVEQSGHFPFVEQPVETLIAVRDFLTRTGEQ